MISITAACATAPSSKIQSTPDDAALLPIFAAGHAQLTELTVFSGYSVAMKEALVASDLRGLYDTRNWHSLAVMVIRTGSGSDLSWFYLGRAAEELGYFPAAKSYFEHSIIAAKKKGISGCIACSGFTFPEDSVKHLLIVEANMNKVAP
jgi:hypothetical protein